MVNTFLPHSDFRKSAKVLDNKRLYKQIVECKQILNILLDKTDKKGYRNHPIVAMWKGYEDALFVYQMEMFKEWAFRRWGFEVKVDNSPKKYKIPEWLGREDFHKSHQSNLLRKDKEHYSKFFKNVSDDLPYVWVK
jgi:mRNA-degrading endonuclease YafQ of YafQ-DinJ toxin-antitoxin module